MARYCSWAEAHADFTATNCTTYPTATAEIIDLNSPTPAWTYTGSMVTGGRKLHNATLLADGKVLVTGGSRGTESPNTAPTNPAYESELWDPATGTWTTMASLTKIRSYHSIALLLPDGRVLSAGGQQFGGSLSRNIFASLSVQRLPSHYHVSAHECYVRAVVFRGHTRCHQHFKSHTDRAFFRYTRL